VCVDTSGWTSTSLWCCLRSHQVFWVLLALWRLLHTALLKHQHTATRCNTLQHVAPRYNTLQHSTLASSAYHTPTHHCSILPRHSSPHTHQYTRCGSPTRSNTHSQTRRLKQATPPHISARKHILHTNGHTEGGRTPHEYVSHGARMKRPETHCTLQDNTTHCNTLQHTATHCNTLQHTATHCNTLQHTASHCITLHHTATHVKVPRALSLACALSRAPRGRSMMVTEQPCGVFDILYLLSSEVFLLLFLLLFSTSWGSDSATWCVCNSSVLQQMRLSNVCT